MKQENDLEQMTAYAKEIERAKMREARAALDKLNKEFRDACNAYATEVQRRAMEAAQEDTERQKDLADKCGGWAFFVPFLAGFRIGRYHAEKRRLLGLSVKDKGGRLPFPNLENGAQFFHCAARASSRLRGPRYSYIIIDEPEDF